MRSTAGARILFLDNYFRTEGGASHAATAVPFGVMYIPLLHNYPNFYEGKCSMKYSGIIVFWLESSL